MTKLIGTQSFINRDTGEIVETQTIQRTGDCDFHKIWLGHILGAVDEIGNKKMQILMFLLSNLDSKNRFIGTCESIAKDLKCHRMTVNSLLVSLEKSNIITRPHRGVLRMNPDVIFKGSKGNRMNILIKYQGEQEQRDMFDEIEDIRERKRKA